MADPLVPAAPQPWRTALLCVVFGCCFVTLIVRLHHLQVDQVGRFTELGERQRSREWRIKASRGDILDAGGNPLVVSVAMWNLYVDPDYMNDKLAATVALSSILDLPKGELRTAFEKPGNGRLLARYISDEQAKAINEWREGYHERSGGRYLEGLTLRRVYRRSFVAGTLAPHVLGFVLDDGTGGAGIELACERWLRGHDGRETLSVDARGRPLIGTNTERIPARDGANVLLSLDTAIQTELELALDEAATKHQAASAAGVVIHPRTGQVVAMASWPSFDPREFASAESASFRNNVLSFVYESGSTMKPLVAGAAVADGLVGWQTMIDCHQGTWTYRRGRAARTIRSHPHGRLSVLEGISKSDNILMAKLGIELGPQRLYDWIRRFGFGRKTGIELSGEDAGIVRPRERWDVLNSCMSVPMGHELAVTPLQMAMAHAAVANDGVWRPPSLIRGVFAEDADGVRRELELDFPRSEPLRLFTKEDADAIERAMIETMESGTGRRAKLAGWTSAGKTGTTEKLIDGRYADDRHIGSFVAWAPAGSTRPAEYLCLVVVDDPQREGYYGSQTAAPVVQRVLQFALDRRFPEYAAARGDTP